MKHALPSIIAIALAVNPAPQQNQQLTDDHEQSIWYCNTRAMAVCPDGPRCFDGGGAHVNMERSQELAEVLCNSKAKKASCRTLEYTRESVCQLGAEPTGGTCAEVGR